MSNDAITSSQTRVWLIEGVSPTRDPQYMGCMKAGDPSWPQGDVTPIKCPDPNKFGSFVEAGQVVGARERVTTSIMGRYPEQLSTLLKVTRQRCRIDVQSHIGACRRGATPQDYLAGWSKILVYRNVRVTNYSQENAGAIEDGENNPYNESGDLSAEEMYEIVPLSFGQQATAETTREIKSIDVCDTADCGECGDESDGCQRVLATMIGAGASPGTLPSVVFSEDGGKTWDTGDIDTLFSNEDPIDAACIGTRFVVISNITNSLHYATTSEILTGTETWVEVNTGFVAGGEPNYIAALDPRHIWIVGDGGYIYFSSNIPAGVSVQDAGVATTENLLEVDAFNTDNVVAVGENNAIVYTENGGETWQALTGPSVGVNLTAVHMWSESVWFVGNASGDVYYTNDSGTTWTEINLPVTPTDIDAIEFVDDTVGYISATVGGAGSLLRTTDGGRDWYVLPESGLALPDADYFVQIALCDNEHNVVFAAGLDGDGTSGIIVKGAGA